MRKRKKTREVRVGNLIIGGSGPVSIQSMTNLPLENVTGTINQINTLAENGADLVRVAVLDEKSVKNLKEILRSVEIPISADVHFNYRIAIESIKAGINKVRINPGNIGDDSRVKDVVKAAKDYGVPIRIGSNSGSVDRKKYSEVTAETLVDSALQNIKILEDNDFYDIVVSIKSSDIFQTIEANQLFSEKRDYPLHIGVTEAGYGLSCTVNSSIAVGHLLLEGIGDTIRVSMTGDPVNEIIVAKKILEAVGERNACIKLVSCPTCGRTYSTEGLLAIAREVEMKAMEKFSKILKEKNETITVAVMGCEVNGPGEAREAHVGIAGGRNGKFILFSKGEKIKSISEDEAVSTVLNEIENILNSEKY